MLKNQDNFPQIHSAQKFSTKLYFNLFKYLPFILLALIFCIVFLIWQNYSYQQKLTTSSLQINLLQQEISSNQQVSGEVIKAKLDKLKEKEQLIHKLQKYLVARGVAVDKKAKLKITKSVEGQVTDSAGGPAVDIQKIIFNTKQQPKTKEQYLLETIKKVPLGKPGGHKITSGFGYRYNPFGNSAIEGHSGIDFKGNIGEKVQTTADGTVEFAGVMGGYGNAIKIKHGFGYTTLYAHLSSIKVKVNQKVKAGDTIGAIGNTGRSTGSHLHYEVRLNNAPINPLRFLALS